jgi:hypothetical protein
MSSRTNYSAYREALEVASSKGATIPFLGKLFYFDFVKIIFNNANSFCISCNKKALFYEIWLSLMKEILIL